MNLFLIFGVLSAISIAMMALDKFVLSKTRVNQVDAKPPAYMAMNYSWGPLFIMVFVVLTLVRYFNFTLILTLATVISLIAVIVHRMFLVPKHKAATKAYKESVATPDEEVLKNIQQGPALLEFTRSLFPVLLIVFILRSFIVEPFQIPSGSMKPTLGVGDFILVNKFAYGIRLPVINKTIIPIGKPQRGDVMVFHYPPNPEVDYIKRIIGVPGDRIQYTEYKQLLINGQPISSSYVKELHDEETYEEYNPMLQRKVSFKVPLQYNLYKENLLGIEHNVYKMDTRSYKSPKPNAEWVVPEGYYFMMGDNRDNSKDSRFWIEDILRQQIKDNPANPLPSAVVVEKCQQLPACNAILNDDKMYMVPEKDIVGKAFFVWMHWPDPKLKNIPSFSKDRLIH